jgi:benzoyl-CoA reductase subunit D
MVTVGIDCGARSVKVALVRDGRLLTCVFEVAGGDIGAACEAAYRKALAEAGLSDDDVQYVVATGSGRRLVNFARQQVTEVGADARGAVAFFPEARTVIDVGAEEGRAIRCTAEGRVVDFVINEKCAAGAGVFVETMARVLEVPVEELGQLALKSEQQLRMNAQCAVFAESEVVSLLHARVAKEDIARAICEATATRVATMVRRLGLERECVLIGGMALNVGFVDALRRALGGGSLLVPEHPQFAGALGAALIAAQQLSLAE